MKQKITSKTIITGAALLAALTTQTGAQQADALLDKLVQKGILTLEEAQSIREESDKGFNQAFQIKTGMPDWVKSMRINGDFRGRYEGFFYDEDVDRNRFRYRLRAGVTFDLIDNFEVGFRVASGGTEDPISTNQTLEKNATKKPIAIDLAYGKWNPVNNKDWNITLSLGKIENPFVFSDMVFDPDYTPEGLSQLVSYNINSKHKLSLILGEFVLGELSASSNDPYLLASQLRLDSKWSDKIESSFGVSALTIEGAQSLTNGLVPNVNIGNSRSGANGWLDNHFNPVVVDGSFTYKLAEFPFYKGAFPIKISADYMNNPAASRASDAYSAGITFGKAGKKNTWEIQYRYKELQANAWWEEVVDSDFGAYYKSALPNSGQGRGYRTGTNVKGHIVKAAYSPFDSLTFSITYFDTELVDKVVPTDSGHAGRLQVDALWKF
jgi:hypothetical protein